MRSPMRLKLIDLEALKILLHSGWGKTVPSSQAPLGDCAQALVSTRKALTLVGDEGELRAAAGD